jgi:hypothetical protein
MSAALHPNNHAHHDRATHSNDLTHRPSFIERGRRLESAKPRSPRRQPSTPCPSRRAAITVAIRIHVPLFGRHADAYGQAKTLEVGRH